MVTFATFRVELSISKLCLKLLQYNDIIALKYKWQSVTGDSDCILAMLIGSSRNGRLEVTQFSVSTTSANGQSNLDICIVQHIINTSVDYKF